jgi:hypothetical protein
LRHFVELRLTMVDLLRTAAVVTGCKKHPADDAHEHAANAPATGHLATEDNIGRGRPPTIPLPRRMKVKGVGNVSGLISGE